MEGTIGRISRAVGGLDGQLTALKSTMRQGVGGGVPRARSVAQQEAAERRAQREKEMGERRAAAAQARAERSREAAAGRAMRLHDAAERRRVRDVERQARKRANKERIDELKRLREEAKRAKERLDDIKRGFEAIKSSARGLGMGPMGRWAGGAARTGAVAGGLAAGFMGGAGLVGGLKQNAAMEQTRNTVATTLQLFNHNNEALGKGTTAAQQFAANLGEGEARMRELIKIANESPGGVEQITELFQGLLPGARSITNDLDRIMQLTQKTTLLSATLGNRFDMVGEQMSRMLTGGAGAEMDTWRLMQKPILEAGQALGYFNKQQAMGQKLTEAFNKLSGDQRLAVVEQSLTALGPAVVDHFGNSMDGIIGTAGSQMKTLSAVFAKPLYESTRRALGKATKDGILNGGTFEKFKDASHYFGGRVAGVADKVYVALERGANYLATNWEKVALGFERGLQTAIAAAKVVMALGATRMAFGAGAKMAGGIMDAGSAIASVGRTIMNMGMSALVMLPVMLAAGAMLGGFAVIVGGAVAYVIERWDEFVDAFVKGWETGAITLRPVFQALDTLWGKFVSVGEAFIGVGDTTDVIQGVINLVASAIDGLTKGIEYLLEFATAGAAVLTAMIRVIRYIAQALDAINPFSIASRITASVNGEEEQGGVINGLKAAEGGLQTMTTALYGASKAWKEGEGTGKFADKLNEELKRKMEEIKKGTGGGKGGSSSTKPPASKTNINVKIVQNFKDQDPDMVVAAYQREFKRQVAAPLASRYANRGRGRG